MSHMDLCFPWRYQLEISIRKTRTSAVKVASQTEGHGPKGTLMYSLAMLSPEPFICRLKGKGAGEGASDWVLQSGARLLVHPIRTFSMLFYLEHDSSDVMSLMNPE